MGRDTRTTSIKNKDTKNEKQEVSHTKSKQKINKKKANQNKSKSQKNKNGANCQESEVRQMRIRAGLVLDKKEVHTICLNNNGSNSSSSEINQNGIQMDEEVLQSDSTVSNNHTNGNTALSKNKVEDKRGNSKRNNKKIATQNYEDQHDQCGQQNQCQSNILNPEVVGVQRLHSNGNSKNDSSLFYDQDKQNFNCNKDVSKSNTNGQRSLPIAKGIKQSDYSQFINLPNNFNSNGNDTNNIQNMTTFNSGFLGKEDQFKDFSIIVGSFQKQHSIFYGSTFIQEAKMRGFNLEIVYDDKEFISKVNSFDIAWIVDNSELNKKYEQQYIESIGTFFKSKKSLYIHAGTNQCYSRTNIILQNFFNNMSLQGKIKPKQKIVNPDLNSQNTLPYSFNRSLSLAHGISTLKLTNDQAIVQQKHDDFSNFIVIQNCQPIVLISEENDQHGRIILDCGFLSYDIKTWSSDHFHHYLSNSTVWLTGIPN
ncbi:type III restriction res subunit family protein, putative (macronuclear) [Tetrahymena thermophila SB210]|uniref:Type III restriction res subunit family protein, putative n=1 Tax=Tetrahymena thermophila (strain SB210) TaxID=312017 RepID=I7M2M1_TETTS|nr:type III restriction res subunit family protein, putative [Tetrahymena thermophila SB210]EAS00798.1 type III restriction res subunit family protein, putative [Tetrahymena thermophila SB210]|eukprot:XP_001021043.1 type III restriction res subunit family protein, putative [Tetrahymena thermophila SB210]